MSLPESHAESALESPVQGLEHLSRERLPTRDLWAGVESRIAPVKLRRREPRIWPLALAASVVAAVLTGLLVRAPRPVEVKAEVLAAVAAPVDDSRSTSSITPYGSHESSALVANRSVHTLRSESRDNAPALVAERAEAGNLRKATYSVGDHHARSQQAILRANLKLVGQAEREVRRALKSDPESDNLKSLLDSAQQKRAQLTALLVHDGE